MRQREIEERIERGYYESELDEPRREYNDIHVFNDLETVRWNREEVKRRNEEIRELRRKYKRSINAGNERFKEDIREYIGERYPTIKDGVFELVYVKGTDIAETGERMRILKSIEAEAKYAEVLLECYMKDYKGDKNEN